MSCRVIVESISIIVIIVSWLSLMFILKVSSWVMS